MERVGHLDYIISPYRSKLFFKSLFLFVFFLLTLCVGTLQQARGWSGEDEDLIVVSKPKFKANYQVGCLKSTALILPIVFVLFMLL